MKLHTAVAWLAIVLSHVALAGDEELKPEFRAEADALKIALEQGEASLPETLLGLEVVHAKNALSNAGIAPQDVETISERLRTDFEHCLRDTPDSVEHLADSLIHRWQQIADCNAAAYERAGLTESRPREDYEPPSFLMEPRTVTPDELLEETRTMTQ